MSDIHLEFAKWPRAVDVREIDADVTVLAGDIGVGLTGIEWALQAFDRPVIYVMGNHEFYGQRPMLDLWRKAREKAASTHVHLLENDSVVIDGVRFLGATFFTDFDIFGGGQREQMMEYAQQVMSDYGYIFVSRRGHRRLELGSSSRAGDRLTPQKVLAIHQESRAFLERELADTSMKTVVVTHHAPSVRSLVGGQAIQRTDAAYASNLDHLVEQAALWIHGHTHVAADYRVGEGRVISNPRGYVGHQLVREFNPRLVVEV